MSLSIRCIAAFRGSASRPGGDGFTPLRKPVRFDTMTQTVPVPLWLLILILLFAAVTALSHLLLPSVRWFFRKRMERAVARLNTRLQRPIEPFKLARRHDMIQRLIYDSQVSAAIGEHARTENVPENVAFELARRYAREIVPSFSATAYFGFGIWLTRWLSRSMYHIRLGSFDGDRLAQVDPDAAVIFVMNHRSNMDYMLVTYLVSRTSALSYAVGEWARVWPLSALIRAMGAYFIRRRARNPLYRKVLARYVQLATAGGVTQAFFPEGGLSLDGRIARPKLGLLSYIVSDFDPSGRDVIFVPVALNYDRVLEDRFLIAAHKSRVRRFRPPLLTVLRGTAFHLWSRMTGRFAKFGTASVGFGPPLSLRAFTAGGQGDATRKVAAELMARMRAVVPVLPVPLVARALCGGATRVPALEAAVAEALGQLAGRAMGLPRRGPARLVADGLAILRERNLVEGPDDDLRIAPGAGDILAFYAASIAHHFEPDQAALQDAGGARGDGADDDGHDGSEDGADAAPAPVSAPVSASAKQ